MINSNNVTRINQGSIDSHFNLVKEDSRIIRYRTWGLDVEFFFKRLDLDRILSPGVKVLELGCGGGNILRYLTKKFGIIPYGVDLKDFTTLYPTNREIEIDFKVSNIQEGLPYDNETFNFVYSFMTFMYLPDKLKGLVECHRVMKVGSLAYIDIQGDRHHNISAKNIPGSIQLHVEIRRNEGIEPPLSKILEKYPNNGQVIPISYLGRDSNALAVKIQKIFTNPLNFPTAESFLIEEDLKLTSVYII